MKQREMTACFLLIAAIAVLSGACGSHSRDRQMGPGMMEDDQREPTTVTSPVPTATPGGSATVSYRQDVRPIFARHCVSCHGGAAGLWLDNYDRILAGSDRGPVIVAGDPEQSELYRRITGQGQPRMPPSGASLSQRDITTIRTWISEGTANN